ncbi:MAG: DNA alkylation repair protein [Nitrospirae bacterium]|nr:DNA alkylation repair protein [Candidatus Manganitrophaceae bacterium]
MPEPFKNLFNAQIISGMGDHFLNAWPDFDRDRFVRAATNNLEMLELKARSEQITQALRKYLPEDYSHAGEIMLSSLTPEDGSDLSNIPVNTKGISGWAVMPMAHYVGLWGMHDFRLSMMLLKEMTIRSSSEFGIRFFLIEKQKETLTVLMEWTNHNNEHVRRLVSEGSRPRLPWAMRLSAFMENPEHILPLLEALKDDPSEYVRRSVANNLNDIAKDHPDRVAGIAEKWLRAASKNRQRLVRHACRTLIKQGHPATLKALGYGPAKVKLEALNLKTPTVNFGDALVFEMALSSEATEDQALIIDYIIHHKKANGRTTPKVFKWKVLTLSAGSTHRAKKKHPFKQITTRVYYPGLHKIEIVVNGAVQEGGAEFELEIKGAQNESQ